MAISGKKMLRVKDWSDASFETSKFVIFLQRKHLIDHEFGVEHKYAKYHLSRISFISALRDYTIRITIIHYVYHMLLQHSSDRWVSARANSRNSSWRWLDQFCARETWRVSRRAAANARGSAPVSVESEVLIALTLCLRWWRSWHQVLTSPELSRQSQSALR